MNNFFTVLKYNLTADERAGRYLRDRGWKVEFVNAAVSGENGLDKIVKEDVLKNFNQMLIKSDTEGYERDVLSTGLHLIKEYKPSLAIAAYHRGDDLLVIPKLIWDANPDYKIYLKPETIDGTFNLFAF